MKKFVMGMYRAYVWKGVNQWQQKASGIIVTDSDGKAEIQAQQLGIQITYLKQRPLILLPRLASKSIKLLDTVFIMRQIATMLTAGIPLVQALEIAGEGAEKVKLRALLLTIRDDVSAGQTFSEALIRYPYYFNKLICGLVSAGERSGTLDQMMIQIASYLEHNELLKSRVKRALYYPVTVLIIATLITSGMLFFLVPKFEDVYKSFGAKLPAYTQLVVNLSHSLQEYWWMFFSFVIVFVVAFKKLKQRSATFQYFLDFLVLKIFLFGKLAQQAIIARTTLTLSITLNAGIPLINALERVADVADNELYRRAFLRTQSEVLKGETMAKSMRETQLFPAIVTQMVSVGEKSGSLDIMLRTISSYYSDQVNTSVEGLTTLIEPILVMFLAVIIGGLVIAMYLPIFNLGSAIK